MNSGIFYVTKGDEQLDMFKVTYNKDNTAFFDIEVLPDNTNYSEDVLFDLLNSKEMFSVIKRQKVSYKNKTNLDILLNTFATQYSSYRYGIRMLGNDNATN